MALLDDYDRSKSYKANKPAATPFIPNTSGYAGPQQYQAKPFTEAAPRQEDFTSSIDAFNKYFQKPVSVEEEEANKRRIARTQVIQNMASILPGMINLGMTVKGAPSQTIPMAQPINTRSYSDRLEKYRNQYATALQQAEAMDRNQYLTQLNQWYTRKQAFDKQEQAREDAANKLAQDWAKHGDTMAFNAYKAQQEKEQKDADRKSREKIAAGHDATSRANNAATNSSRERLQSIRSGKTAGNISFPLGDGSYGTIDANKLSDANVGYIAKALQYKDDNGTLHSVPLVDDRNKPLTKAQLIERIGEHIEESPEAIKRLRALINDTQAEKDEDFWGDNIAYTPGVKRKGTNPSDSIPDLEFK